MNSSGSEVPSITEVLRVDLDVVNSFFNEFITKTNAGMSATVEELMIAKLAINQVARGL